jgi:hypothetical protein
MIFYKIILIVYINCFSNFKACNRREAFHLISAFDNFRSLTFYIPVWYRHWPGYEPKPRQFLSLEPLENSTDPKYCLGLFLIYIDNIYNIEKLPALEKLNFV